MYVNVTSSIWLNVSDRSQEPSIDVTTTHNSTGRKWDKKFYCYFCSTLQSKLPRHLRAQHADREEVASWTNEASKAKRAQKLLQIRNMGNHLHNCEVLKRGQGTLILSYRPATNESVDPRDYGPCPHCFGYFIRRELWRHKCPMKESNKLHERIAHKSSLLLPPPPGSSQLLQQITCPMKSDEVSRVAKSDTVIVKSAEREFLKAGHDKDRHNNVRTRMRELGRLLIQLRLTSGKKNASLDSFLTPPMYPTVVSAVLSLCGFDSQSSTYAIPSLAIRLGHAIKNCAGILRGEALQQEKMSEAQMRKTFQTLCGLNWTNDVSAHAHRTLVEAKRNNPTVLPTSSDVVVLTNYLKATAEAAMKMLDEEMLAAGHHEGPRELRPDTWNVLNEVTLTQVILFNRRRQGEVSKMKVEDLLKKRMVSPDSMSGLSKVERSLCKFFEVVEVVGKRVRTVPVLLSPTLSKQLTRLHETREHAGVIVSNVYLFARCHYNSEGHIRGSDTMRKYAKYAGCEHPENLRSTKLRKQVATSAQILELSESQFQLLCKHMGHDPTVHREYYQLPDNVQRVAKLSKLLLVLEKGTLGSQAGKDLDDLSIESNPEGKEPYRPFTCPCPLPLLLIIIFVPQLLTGNV